ncbi:MFS transporter [Aquihabitans sp. G128]|uniref:MFS transporter n=1 Tax=Aquihabitans sp. G128 TaxID=2849779 RepID=UPI001C232B7D|nr:MFS transporter [Aquihabitans sp. G128]QXC60484.1 MFS transporter [Aquihabitans sp. G128]HWJ63688.1 MFS transporter [Acidimicrobiales bacterium]
MTTTTGTGPPAQAPAHNDEVIVDPRRRLLILAAMCVALVAVVASVSGLNVAQQALAEDLDASQSQLLWIINGYTLALAALLMPVGAIGDRWGRKPVLMIGLVAFSLLNLASAFATEPNVLIALRVLAGASAAMIMPVTLSVITTSFPREDQAKAIGTWAGFAGAGGIIGLFASAAIIDNATWPWVFALPIALAAVSFVLTTAFVPHSVEHTEAGFDIAGSLLSALAVGGLVLAFHEGPERGWTDPLTIAALAAGLVGSVAFVLVELRREHPLVDVRVFAVRGLAAGSVNLFVVFAVMFSLFLVLVQYLQAVLGYSALKAASGLLPMALIMMPLSTIAPTIAERIGFRRTLVTGMLLLAGGLVLFATLADPDGGYLSVLPGILVLGTGVGLAMSPSTAAITSSLPEEKQGVASALNDTVREMGGAVGIALIGSVLNSAYRSNIEPTVASLPPEVAEPVTSGIGGALAVAGKMGTGGAALVDASRQAFVDGMAPALYLGAGLALAAAVFTALRGPKTAAEAEPRLHAGDQTAPRPDVPDLSVNHTARSGSNHPNVESTGAEAAAPGESSGNMTGVIDTGGGPR